MKKLIILIIGLLVLGSACKKDFLNVDESNPNSASAVPANLVLPAALNSVAELIDQPDNYNFVYLWHGMWAISNSYIPPTNLTQYNLLNSSYQGIWDNSYLALQNFDYVEQASLASSQKNFRAIAIIMKAYLFHNLVDCYGNIPYKEALKGSGAGQNLKPAYDPQQSIYEDLAIRIDTAINLIQKATTSDAAVGSADIIYQGDMSKWAKFANTIKLRILLNQADMAGRTAYITGALATTASVGFIGAGEGAMLNPGYLQTANKMNVFWENFFKQDGSVQSGGLDYYVSNQDACTFLTNNNDPRKLRIFQPYTGTSVQGNYFGGYVLLSVPNTSKLGFGLLQGYNQSSPILTDFESLFLQAEAVQRGIITTGDAKALYESAVTQSILFLGQKSTLDPSSYVPLTAADAATYLAQVKPLVNFDASPNKIQAIITQKWVALNGISPMPIWTDYRRTGFPDFIHFSIDPLRLSDTPPVRLLYPQTEITANNDNVQLQGTISLTDSKIFWQNR
jgi:Starch-binding associating with outer membrane